MSGSIISYKIVRHYATDIRGRMMIHSGLTLEQAQEYCSDPETSSRTCTSAVKKAYTRKNGEWFDTWTEE